MNKPTHDPYAERPDKYFTDLYNDLRSQLCCAWEEWAEQHAEADADRPDAMKGSKSVVFKDNHIVVVGNDGSINHFKFNLEMVS